MRLAPSSTKSVRRRNGLEPPGARRAIGRTWSTGDTMGYVNRFLHKLTARLGRRGHGSATGLGIPCVVCGEPATGWAIYADDQNGVQVIDGYAACPSHQAEAEGVPDTKAG